MNWKHLIWIIPKVDLLTIRKQVDRQDKEKRIKDSMKDNCIKTENCTCTICALERKGIL